MSLSFDPTLPVDGSLISAVELRNQLNSLDAEISDANNNAEGRAFKPSTVALLGLTVSNPPTQAQVQATADKLDELITRLNI
jgi:hypothetical protein